MGKANFLFSDGQLTKAGKLIISPDNRSFRYGDGFFETMKMAKGRLLLADFHMERLFSTLAILQFQPPAYFTPDYLKDLIQQLALKNGHNKLARIRLTIYRGDGGLYDLTNHFPHHLIQTWELNPANNQFNENGLDIGVYTSAKKSYDEFSSLKSNNFLAYAMAAIWVKQQKLNDAILLNHFDRVADATIANVFIVHEGVIKTPPLSEGPIGGVMRRYLLNQLREASMPVAETPITLDDIHNASEIFLTNSIYGIRWVKQLGENGYTQQMASRLHKKMMLPLFSL
jgi:branched-chain amino acid aminotransferase